MVFMAFYCVLDYKVSYNKDYVEEIHMQENSMRAIC